MAEQIDHDGDSTHEKANIQENQLKTNIEIKSSTVEDRKMQLMRNMAQLRLEVSIYRFI